MSVGIFLLVLFVLRLIFGMRIVFSILIGMVLARFLCDIDIAEGYTWYSGIWHGMFFVPNYALHLFADTPFKAEFYTSGYNVCHWIFSIISTVLYALGRL